MKNFNNVTKINAVEIQQFLQLRDVPSHVAKFDTLQIINDIKIPNGNWNTSNIPEPITSTMPELGSGGATQAITKNPIKNYELQELIKNGR